MSKISVLGSTGSIGIQALDVVRMHKLEVSAISANSNVLMLEAQAREFKPEYACIFDESMREDLAVRLADTDVKVVSGMDGLCGIASLPDADMVLNSVVGMVGLLPTLTAIDAGKNVALANKETLVAGGNIVMKAAQGNGVRILPVDSEHSAIFQALQGNSHNKIKKVILTASGGAFYGMSKHDLQMVTVEDALKNPNWEMGSKVTVDSSTLMNKGLEFIEAKWLFDLEPEQIEVVVHRQSIMHSAAEFDDNSIIAQLSTPDMRLPIQYALMYPQRVKSPIKSLSLTECACLTFEKPDTETFGCLKCAIQAITKGGAYPCILNAANEIAVDMFLKEKIPFIAISDLINDTLSKFSYHDADTYDDIMEFDAQARQYAKELSHKYNSAFKRTMLNRDV